MWTFAVGPWNGLPDTELSRLTGRSITCRLGNEGGTVTSASNNSEASFTVDGSLPEAQSVHELISDLWCLRNGQTLFRGRVGPSADAGSVDQELSTFSAADYRALFNRRMFRTGDSLVYSSQDIGQTAWNILAQTQAKAGGNWGIIRGAGGTTGVVQSNTFSAGDLIGSTLEKLSAGSPGFDFDITPTTGITTQTFDIWYPQRGTDRQAILDFPGRIQSYTRQVDPGAFANSIRGTGTTGLGPNEQDTAGIGTDPAGRFEAALADTAIQTTSALAARTTALLATAQTVIPSWTVTLSPNSWGGPTDVWLGDPVTLQINAGRHAGTIFTYRVFEIKIDLDDQSDAETVTVTLGLPSPTRRWLLRGFDRRLAALDKR
jgi:hypothetical protein